jgi:hypothetical protein
MTVAAWKHLAGEAKRNIENRSFPLCRVKGANPSGRNIWRRSRHLLEEAVRFSWAVNLFILAISIFRTLQAVPNVIANSVHIMFRDRLCGLVVRDPGDISRGPDSIPGATRFSEKQWVWNRVHSASWVQLSSYLEEKLAAPVKKSENMVVGIRRDDHVISTHRSWRWFRRQATVARPE